jgi:BolA protein
MGIVRDAIISRLTEALSPERLEVVDDSDHHKGHSGAREGGESHFTVTVVSKVFQGLNRVQRQRLVNGALKVELAGPVHALSIRALAPDEG